MEDMGTAKVQHDAGLRIPFGTTVTADSGLGVYHLYRQTGFGQLARQNRAC
jgi:hypothetical protein